MEKHADYIYYSFFYLFPNRVVMWVSLCNNKGMNNNYYTVQGSYLHYIYSVLLMNQVKKKTRRLVTGELKTKS